MAFQIKFRNWRLVLTIKLLCMAFAEVWVELSTILRFTRFGPSDFGATISRHRLEFFAAQQVRPNRSLSSVIKVSDGGWSITREWIMAR